MDTEILMDTEPSTGFDYREEYVRRILNKILSW